MVKNVGGWCLLTLLGSAAMDGVQLPPHVLMDQLLLRSEQLIEADDLDAAVPVMNEALALAKEHDLGLPSDYLFQHARIAFAVGLLGTAKESVTEHLVAASREAESYAAAVALLEDVDRILERRDAPECGPEPESSDCWMELASHPACYVWNPVPQSTETATWTGECSAGFASGAGTLNWTYRDGQQESEGNLRYGRFHGEYVGRNDDGSAGEGPYRFGERHGHWVLRSADGGVHEGLFANGKKNGSWVERFADGDVAEGRYVDGEENGHWILRFASGGVQEGPYVDGERNGDWVERFTDNRGVQEGPYRDGERNGRWILRFASGGVQEGPYVDGERNGDWVVRYADERGFQQGPFVDGKRHGHWVLRFTDYRGIQEGPYRDGEMHGEWVLRFADGQVERGPYVEGERHGPWRVLFPDGEVDYVEFVRGVQQEPRSLSTAGAG